MREEEIEVDSRVADNSFDAKVRGGGCSGPGREGQLGLGCWNLMDSDCLEGTVGGCCLLCINLSLFTSEGQLETGVSEPIRS